jgi:hypothetical protein
MATENPLDKYINSQTKKYGYKEFFDLVLSKENNFIQHYKPINNMFNFEYIDEPITKKVYEEFINRPIFNVSSIRFNKNMICMDILAMNKDIPYSEIMYYLLTKIGYSYSDDYNFYNKILNEYISDHLLPYYTSLKLEVLKNCKCIFLDSYSFFFIEMLNEDFFNNYPNYFTVKNRFDCLNLIEQRNKYIPITSKIDLVSSVMDKSSYHDKTLKLYDKAVRRDKLDKIITRIS